MCSIPSPRQRLHEYLVRTIHSKLPFYLAIMSFSGILNATLFAQQQTVEGFAKEFIVRDYPLPPATIPLLQNFYFRFTSGDRHILMTEVDPTSSLPPFDRITLRYFDDSRNDEFFYKAAHHAIPSTGIQTDGLVFFPKGKETLPITRPGPNFELILIDFDFAYRNGDHHIDEVGVLQEGANSLTVFFNDKNDDDPALSRIQYAWVPTASIVSMGVATGTNKGADKESIPSGIRVIRGFRVNYKKKDHHLKEIGVLTTATTSGDLEVYYSDKNQDDQFDWEVRWAILDPGILDPFGIVLDGINATFKAALESNDTSGLESLLHDDFVLTDNGGAVIGKRDWLEMIKKGVVTYKFDDDDARNIRVFGNTAIVAGGARVTRSAGGATLCGQCRFSRTYVFDGQQWRAVAIELIRVGE